MQKHGYHIITEFNPEMPPIILQDQYGEVHFHPIPYIDPSTIKQAYKTDAVQSFDDAYRYLIEKLTPTLDPHATPTYPLCSPCGDRPCFCAPFK